MGRRSSEFDLPLAWFRQEILAAKLLPKSYAKYQPLLADGLVFFLEHLPAARLRRIFSEQAQLAPGTPMAERVVALLHHVPALHKLGQVVARDRRLNSGFRKNLQRLESFSPRTTPRAVTEALKREFKGWQKAGICLAGPPLAEGSVAVVLPFIPRSASFKKSGASLLSQGSRRLERGVFKLLKPGIESILEEDLEVLSKLGDFLDEDCERYHLPSLDYRETFDSIRDLLLHEVHLEEEQRNLVEAWECYAAAPGIKIPVLFSFCSKRLTAMEQISGTKLTDWHGKDQPARETLARRAARALIAEPLFSLKPDSLFHADPHAGNLLATDEGEVGILDWSLTGRLSADARAELFQLVLGAMVLDYAWMAGAVSKLSERTVAIDGQRAIVENSLRELRQGRLPGMCWLTRLLDALVLQAGARFNAQLLLFRKVLLTLEGVLADLLGNEAAARETIDEVVLAGFLGWLNIEWPTRLFAPWHSRQFRTRISTMDMLRLLWSSPLAAARWWKPASGIER